jgi:hypothetical protein
MVALLEKAGFQERFIVFGPVDGRKDAYAVRIVGSGLTLTSISASHSPAIEEVPLVKLPLKLRLGDLSKSP